MAPTAERLDLWPHKNSVLKWIDTDNIQPTDNIYQEHIIPNESEACIQNHAGRQKVLGAVHHTDFSQSPLETRAVAQVANSIISARVKPVPALCVWAPEVQWRICASHLLSIKANAWLKVSSLSCHNQIKRKLRRKVKKIDKKVDG